MVANRIHKMTEVLWPAPFLRVLLLLAASLLIGALTPAAVVALDNHGVAPAASTTAAIALIVEPVAYRFTNQPNGTTTVQRTRDGGITWPTVGLIPDLVAQLAVNPADDTDILARTGTSLWRSGNGGVSWVRIDSLPGHPLALAFAGSRNLSGLIFAGTDTRGLYSSLDGGTTWYAVGGPLTSLGVGSLAVTALAVTLGDHHVVYAAVTFTMATPAGEHSSQAVYISLDDGRQWVEMKSARGFDQTITQLIPLRDPFLGALRMIPFAAQWLAWK
jgi:photosystem II stability/assembly factor-like uncharacterized protein